MMRDYDVLTLDVRTQTEFDEGHIERAVLLPVDEIAQRATEVILSFEQVVLIYCRSGVRSENAARALSEMGFVNVYDFGGIIDWPYETMITLIGG